MAGVRLLTPLLWHAINHPPATHPLFWRTVHRTPSQLAHSQKAVTSLMDRLSMVYLVLFTGALLFTNMLDLSLQSAALVFLLFLLSLPVLLPIALLLRITLFSGSFYGTLWAMQISQALTRERASSTFDLLALLPHGALAGAWAISTGCLYRHHTFTHVLDLRTVTLRVMMLGGILFMLSAMLDSSHHQWPTLVLLGTQTVAALAFLHIDYIHSTILATLIGMSAQTVSRVDSRLWVVGGFLFLQVATYTLTMLGAYIFASQLFALGVADWLAHVITLIVSIGLFFSVRESTIHILWRQIRHQSNTHDTDLACIFAHERLVVK
jgi:hypothetical protein